MDLINETKPHEEQEILRVYGILNRESGKKGIHWDYGKGVNAYFLIGLLEDIKKELLDQIDTSSQDDEINY